MAIIDPDSIKFLIQNTPDPKTGNSRGYTIGYRNGRRDVITDDVGAALGKVMSERANKEYSGQLVTPKGDPLSEVIATGIKIDRVELDARVLKKI